MARIQLILTLDYEIHGNGEGSPRDLMVRPTDRLLEMLNTVDGKLTIMADVVEIWRFLEAAGTSSDPFHGRAIENQLKETIASGHDVQLHLHPSYRNAEFRGGRWVQDYSEYSCADLGFDLLDRLVREGRDYLETLLRPVDPDYTCLAFRAANWSMHPSRDITQALIKNGIRFDSSVFRGGRRDGMVRFDYQNTPSSLIPWRASTSDVCIEDPSSPLLEIPIYTEQRRIWSFLSEGRVRRAILSRRHPVKGVRSAGRSGSLINRLVSLLGGRHPWKLDFNQCSARQIVGALRRIETAYPDTAVTLPVVLIGHSKLFDSANAAELGRVLGFIRERRETFSFTTFRSLSLPDASPVAA
jgi:hypothetical protein